ncbi:hypothetical protein J5N58_09000 [Rhizobium cremeum]|uniref:hypothetical protein n=1 Tax=Rhizobium cremeum TaxID=2813827 RepID=UPI0013AED418|nr:hypothetical protein [Rhizobium cremeum]MCJ7994311.1 hypothetical protein [Rhizobium cremeum]MCJ7999810.1 hypothetical protein [Rhizobium cremeum]
MTTRMKALIVATNISLAMWAGLIGVGVWALGDDRPHLDGQLTASIGSAEGTKCY